MTREIPLIHPGEILLEDWLKPLGRIYNSSATATKKTSISDTAKKHQNIAGDRKWMPTVILRPLNEVA